MITIGIDPGSRVAGIALCGTIQCKNLIYSRKLTDVVSGDFYKALCEIVNLVGGPKHIKAIFVESWKGFSGIGADVFANMWRWHGAATEAAAILRIPVISILVKEWRDATIGSPPKHITRRLKKNGEHVYMPYWTKGSKGSKKKKKIDIPGNLQAPILKYVSRFMDYKKVILMSLDEQEAFCIATAGQILLMQGKYEGI